MRPSRIYAGARSVEVFSMGTKCDVKGCISEHKDLDEREPRLAGRPPARTSETAQPVAAPAPAVPRHFRETVNPRAVHPDFALPGRLPEQTFTVGESMLNPHVEEVRHAKAVVGIYEREEARIKAELEKPHEFDVAYDACGRRQAYNPVTHFVNAFGDIAFGDIEAHLGIAKHVDTRPKPVGLAGDSATRKESPIYEGFVCYFPNAMAEVARLSKYGNDKHNPGTELHWSFNKSNDHGDCIMRHQTQAEQVDDSCGFLHAVMVAWRAMAQLEKILLETHPELVPGKNVKGFVR
jgi:hypothetical protein